ncbi:Mth938-like domain-containing protein [Sneathiella sp. HT1-7]|uniref:Mth938-like domain-containing protein n=1 Tax=Sneathiella sp. HT1-7 TaxID=2887192 RepID=UPI001D14F67E|nr:Mth938-like domain-containing protein [Sneathiella sp. HT1-7]MCC3305009.1 Mth938-like domain-containing protein [Sneathiella sp. HT1-7]
MQDISGLPQEGQQLINGYGDGGFRVSGVWYEGSVLILPEKTENWSLADIDGISLDSLASLIEKSDEIEILLIGCGDGMAYIEDDIRNALREKGIVIDAMGTGAAVRTYNVLLLERRRVAAALIAI